MPSFTLFLLSLISLFILSHTQTTTLTLTPTTISPPSTTTTPFQRLNLLVTASTTRAHNLKHPKTNTSTITNNVPLYPRGYGGYSVSLSFGTPPQQLSFIVDTGSSLVWSPCTKRYSCSSCNFVNVNPSNIPTFIPRTSSSSNIIGCKNPKCKWLYPNVKCVECPVNATSSSCTQTCPPYIIQYGSGSTTGLLLSETLNFPKSFVKNFMLGCSIFSSRQPSGIAGFGRGPESLPVQMRLKRFSYCLVSHRFDDKPVSSDLVLVTSGRAGKTGVSYTPFRKNPKSSNPAFEDYYYVTLRKITVGGVNVKVSYKYLVPDTNGNGGTIVDSGTTFTYMEKNVFELVAKEFEKQAGKSYRRVTKVENETGLKPCFNVSGKDSFTLPQLVFHFKGGAKMVFPIGDYFSFLDENVVCMTIVSSDGAGGGTGLGPAIILGNYQQQNFHIEYDLENERFGFEKKLCK